MGPGAKPCPSLPLLTPGLTERGGSHEGLSRIRPAIRVGVMRVVDSKIIDQTDGKVCGRGEVPPFEKATRQDTQPEFDLIQPRSMGRRKMEHMRMSGVTQESPPLLPPIQSLGIEGERHTTRPRGDTHPDSSAC